MNTAGRDFVENDSLIADRYRIRFLSGVCGFTKIFRARDTDNRTVSLELMELAVVPSTFFDHDGQLRHIPLLQSLDHPNIPKLLDHGETVIGNKQFVYLASDYLSGESIADLLRREGTISPYRALPIILELLEILDYLHNLSVPVVHNGISPCTILLDYSTGRDKPVLRGFEWAKGIHESRKTFSLGGASLVHAAPELLSNVFVPQSDLFSTGALLYQLVVGFPPWFRTVIPADDLDGAKQAVKRARAKPLSFELIDQDILDEYLKSVFRKALSINVQDRFQSAAEFAKALKREGMPESIDIVQMSEWKSRKSEKRQGEGFTGIAGMDDLKTLLYNEVIRPIVERERFERFGIPLLNGVLLFGPPGCGKTLIAERLVEEVGFNFIKMHPSDLASPYVHGGQEKIGNLFKEAEERAPCIIFLDEIDAIVPSREGDVQHHYAAEVNEILAQMSSCGERGIFVIGATNRPEKIDVAMLRAGRFDKLIYVPQPDLAAREAIFKLQLSKRPVDLAVDYRRIAELTENYVSSDIAKLSVEAARKAEKMDCRITMEILEKVISENNPSVSKKELKKYDELNKRWTEERRGVDPDRRTPIGFVLRDDQG